MVLSIGFAGHDLMALPSSVAAKFHIDNCEMMIMISTNER